MKQLQRIRYVLGHTIQRSLMIVLALFILAAPQIASAQSRGYDGLTPEQLEQLGIYFAKGNYNCGTETTSAVGGGTADPSNNQGSWNSGLQPPYILEQFFIETLKDIAQKRGVSAQNTVTEEHVIALVAFAIGEGGDINNQDIFNPLNTGINAPDLTVGGEHVTNGLQSFKSFDAGVEANARVMTGQNQHRLSDILIQPNSTAEEFMEALTYYTRYPKNLFWAEASLPPNTDKYYEQRLQLVRQVRKNYAASAALVIGTPELEFKTRHIIPSKLQFHPAGSINTSGTAADTSSTAAGDSCVCSSGDNKPVIVLDPGHSGTAKTVIDTATNLKDYDYPNTPELEDAFDVAQIAQTQLQAGGYKVIMTKANANDTVTLRQRADIANSNKAALAVSIHDQGGSNGGLPFSAPNHVYIQQNGLYRVNEKGDKVTFNNSAVADLSAKYGTIFAQERTAAEGHPIDVQQANLGGRDGPADGNIWMVQLFSNVPWIYNEAGGISSGGTGARPGGLNNQDKQKYATGIVNGVKKAVPIKAGDNSACAKGNWSETVKKYALPQYHKPDYCFSTEEYQRATEAAKARIEEHRKDRNKPNDYIGADCRVNGKLYLSIDCGAFVTRVFRDSGADPDYNDHFSWVVEQHKYLNEHPEKYRELKGAEHPKKASDLRKGDIFIAADDGHTYIFVGDGFWQGYNVASASKSERAPMASKAYDIAESRWYRPLYPID